MPLHIIQQVDDWQSKTPAQLAAAVAAVVYVADSTPVTVARIVDAVGEDQADLVVGTVDSVGTQKPTIKSTFIALATTGIDLSPPARQLQIETLATVGNWPAETTAAIKALGQRPITRWESLGGSGDPPDATAIGETIAREALAAEWVACLNDGGINAAVAAGDRAALVSALVSAADVIGGDA